MLNQIPNANVLRMWKVYAKRGGVALGVLVFLYGFFWMNVGYQSAFRHSQDVWNSPVMQEKRDLVQGEVKGFFKGGIEKAATQQKKLAKKNPKRTRNEPITEDDRKSLDKLINNAAN